MDGQPFMGKGRYGLTNEEHVNKVYDPYCSGGGFLMSHDTINKIIILLLDQKKPLKIDDAYIGQLVHVVKINATHMDGFYMWN